MLLYVAAASPAVTGTFRAHTGVYLIGPGCSRRVWPWGVCSCVDTVKANFPHKRNGGLKLLLCLAREPNNGISTQRGIRHVPPDAVHNTPVASMRVAPPAGTPTWHQPVQRHQEVAGMQVKHPAAKCKKPPQPECLARIASYQLLHSGQAA